MKRMKLHWKKAAALAAAAVAVMQAGFLGTAGAALAQEESGGTDLKELTAPELQTEEGAASSARLRIGEWLDYGDYGIEREDVPGTDYFFYITTWDQEDAVINDDQLAYCVQSYFLTPLPGDHSEDMTDQVSSIGGEKNLQKVIYYGYAGAGYEADEFVEFLSQADAGYYENVYAALSESEQAELAYILTHAAASYAYYLDGTSLEAYMEIQFQLRYGEDWAEELDRFMEQELEKAQITDGDTDLFGATYGMNPTGIALTRGWYQILTDKEEPGLSITEADDIYTFNGNERNAELKLTFSVPDGLSCTVFGTDGEETVVPAGAEAAVSPGESFAFLYTDETSSRMPGGISELSIPVEGTLLGTENEAWNLVLLQTYKGTSTAITKRQQDIASVSMVDAGQTELDFEIELVKGSVAITLTDDAEQGVEGVRFGVYYDAACSEPVRQDGEDVEMVTDSLGEAYLEFVVNQKLQDHEEGLYVRAREVPTGYLMDDGTRFIGVNESAALTGERESVSVSGAVSWKVPEGTKLPDAVSISLRQDGEVIDTKTVTAKDQWSYEWDGLPKYRKGQGTVAAEYDYTIDIATVDGYDTVTDGYDVVSTVTGETSVTGQVIWHDHDDADDLRPDNITVNLYQDEDLIDSEQVSGENDWTYSFEGLDRYSGDGSREHTYTVRPEAPEGYTFEIEGDQIIGTHTAAAAADIEGLVDLSGRDLTAGEFSFELTQVTDDTGEVEAEGGVHETGVNDAEGKIVFPEIVYTEPGIYYYRITETADDAEKPKLPASDGEEITEDNMEENIEENTEENTEEDTEEGTEKNTKESIKDNTEEAEALAQEDAKAAAAIVKVEVSVDGEDMDRLKASVTYPNGQPEFNYTYTASGETVIGDILIVLENGTLEDGAFQVELRDEDGNVLQTAANDPEGKVTFEALQYTQEDIGKEYTYTIAETDGGAENITYDTTVYTVTVKIEDGMDGDGTLEITQEEAAMIFVNTFTVPETETESEAPETETESEVLETEQETETEFEALETEQETETESEALEIETESELAETGTETITEAGAETETESVEEAQDKAAGADRETSAEEENENTGNSTVILIVVLLIVLAVCGFFWYKKRKK